MSHSRLELPSGRGDQTIAGVRFVLYGASHDSARMVAEHGLPFVEGGGIVSTSLMEAYARAAGETEGVITVLAVPSEFHLGYAAFTTAFIQRWDKRVVGAPLRYAAARRHLAFYRDAETEAARQTVEAEIEGGSHFADHVRYNIDPHHVLGTFKVGQGMLNTITALEVSAKAFESLDFARLESALQELFTSREPAQDVLVPTMVRDLIVGTVESVIMSRLRMMRWQGLALLGYTIKEGREDVAVTRVTDIAEQRRRMQEYTQMLSTSNLFTGELAWLKVYAAHELDLMRVELDGAELEAA